ncbi:calcium-binding protein [Cupriavidus sp. USMAA2-4]|uniref:calcium-binding protein n=1 Tax=Cupriavidus sp. USMAA2-4 TaxID=876364 RepID=UPI000B14B181|nr:calcium-binding protein [Cupriavidus sp. USMAA2-4]
MSKALSLAQLTNYRTRITSGGLAEAVKVYGELYDQGYNYAGWARGVATGSTVTGVSALGFLSSSAMLGIGINACKNLSSAQMNKIRVDMAIGYVDSLIDLANMPKTGGVVREDVSFKSTQAFHDKVFKVNGLSIENWTLKTPMALIAKTQGDAAVEAIWQSLRDTGGDGPDAILASTMLSTRVGKLAFSSDPAIARAAQAWMDQTPGLANVEQVKRSLWALKEAVFGGTSTGAAGADLDSSFINSVTSLALQSAPNGGVTTVATVKVANGAPRSYRITTRPLDSGALAGGSLITTTNTQNGQVSYQLQNADGRTSQGNVAVNGNVSFHIDNATYVYKDGVYLGSFDPISSLGALVNGGSGSYRYNPTTGEISKTVSTVGGRYVNGFTATQTSVNGVNWSAPVYTFDNADAATAADYAVWAAFGKGTVDKFTFQNLVNASSDFLVSSTFTRPGKCGPLDLGPFGAFYESKSAGLDRAASIAGKTFRIMTGAGVGLSAAQLAARDANADGRLSGAELDGLYAWSDLNEDGVLNQTTTASNEFTTLGAALASLGLGSVRASDYAFHTAGNANYRSVAQSNAAAPGNWRVAPGTPAAQASNYATLRDTDNRFYVHAHFWIDWATSQVKLSSNQQNMVGTDNNDTFDIGYYAAYDGKYFNLSLVRNFYAGGGHDLVGGSKRDDNIWGGTGNDTLLGYDGNDKLYGEDGDDQLEGGAGNDILHGGAGNDLLFGDDGHDTLVGGDGRDELQGGAGNDHLDGGAGDDKLFGGVGNDTMNGGDGNDVMMGFTASNDARQSLAWGESDDDTMFGGNGADEMYGGLGNDYMDGGADDDLVVGGEGHDTLFGGAGNDEVNGGNGNDVLDGGSGADKMFGGAGNDLMWGGDGNDIMVGFTPSNDRQTLAAGETDDDVMYGGAGDDLMLGGFGDDQMWGGVGNDELQGGAGNDVMYGEAGNDKLFGQAGNDIIYGGDGDDIIYGFTASNEAKQTLAAGETDDDFLYGGAGNDTLVGGLGNDYLDGGAGADYMEGGQGNDTYVVNSVNDVILEQRGEGYDTVISSANYILNANIEELRLVEGYNIHGTGNSLDNRIIGNSQDNILDGVTGADTMIGGLGNDTYYVDNVGDRVVELAGEGIDTVNASISYTLGANVENLTLLDFSKAEKGVADGVGILVYGYPKAFELDYMQGDAVAGYKGTCALTAIANLTTQANQARSEADVVRAAISNNWCVTDAAKTDYQRGGSNYIGQQALLNSYGIRNGIISGYNEEAIANLIKGGRGVILGVNAGKLWGDRGYLDNGGVNHVVTVTGVACDEATGAINGFYIADSGRGKVSDMTRYVAIADFRANANVDSAYAIYTIDPIKLWEENINGTGNELDNVIRGNRGNNILTGGKGNDTLMGGAGDDTYVFARGDGRDTIAERDATAGNTDVLRFKDVKQADLWFKHVGNDLQISILGSTDQISIKDWYVAGTSGTDHQVERIQTADGLTMYNTDVEKFVQAMAAFAPPGGTQTDWTGGQGRDEPVLIACPH